MADLILNPETNHYIKRTSQTGKRLLKQLRTIDQKPLEIVQPIQQPEPVIEPSTKRKPGRPFKQPNSSIKIQNEIVNIGVEAVANDPKKFKNLTDKEVDKLFKKLLLERLNIKSEKFTKQKPVKTTRKFKVTQPSSDSESDSD